MEQVLLYIKSSIIEGYISYKFDELIAIPSHQLVVRLSSAIALAEISILMRRCISSKGQSRHSSWRRSDYVIGGFRYSSGRLTGEGRRCH